MEERRTRSGRAVRNVVRYELEEVNLIDDFSDDGYENSDFEGTLDGLSEGSHLENSDSDDGSYTEKYTEAQSASESDEDDDDDMTCDDNDSVITEHIPSEEILEFEDSDSNGEYSEHADDETESDESESDSDSESDSGSDSGSDSTSDSSSGSESGSDSEVEIVPRKAWQKDSST